MQTPLICRRLVECFLSVMWHDNRRCRSPSWCSKSKYVCRKAYRSLDRVDVEPEAHRITHFGFSLPRLLPPVIPAPRVRRSPAPLVRSFSCRPVRTRASFLSEGLRPLPCRCRRSCLTTSKKAFSTLTQFLADASTKSQPSSFARA